MSKKTLSCFFFPGAAFFLFFFWVHKIPLWSSDEGRYAEIAREALELKDFIVPHFNYLPHLEKPILAPLLTTFSFMLFGVNSLSARLPSILSALAGIFMTYGFTRKLFNEKTAFYAALLLTTSIGYVLVGRFAVIDMILTLLFAGAFFCLMTACLQQKPPYYLAAYAFMGFAFLAKGLIGLILPLLVFSVFLLWTGNLKEVRKMSLGWGILILGVIILPWVIAISLREPDFFDYFVIKSHFSRFAEASFGRKRPFWFFIPILIGFSFPWSFFLPGALARTFKLEKEAQLKIRFLLTWIAVIFLFFSLSRSKLPYYLLPVSIPVAIFVATLFADRESRRQGSGNFLDRWTWLAIVIFFIGTAAGLNIYLAIQHSDPEMAALRPMAPGMALVLGGGGILAYGLRIKQSLNAGIFALAGTVYAGLIITIICMKIISPFQSTFAFAQFLKPQLTDQDTVAVYASPDRFSDLIFYLERRIMIAGSDWGTLSRVFENPRMEAYGDKWFPSAEEFADLFDAKKSRIFCLTESERYQELLNAGLNDYPVLKKEGGKIMITNQKGPLS
ncbi:MAG TPA: glycosyltransferase family 39 protein [bacterium]|nr:glycosyltransferase family 39 protein [bacterium]